MNSTIESLNKIITVLTEMKRFEELIEILDSWEKEFVTDIGKVKIFYSLYIREKGRSLKRVDYLKDDLKYYKEMMDVNYPKTRLLNKLVREYNTLFDIYIDVDVEYTIRDLEGKLRGLV
jgi:hypothetical protein